MNNYNEYRATVEGKMAFRVSKGLSVRYCLASSYEQCVAKFRGWAVYPITMDEFKDKKWNLK